MKHDVLISTNSQKVLDFLLDYPFGDFLETEIREAVKVSRSGVNYALKSLTDANFITRSKRGRSFFYSLNRRDPVIKQMKVVKAVLAIEDLVNSLRQVSYRIILFGSASRGENASDSDIDLFVVSRLREQVDEIVGRFRAGQTVQAIVRSPVQFNEMRIKEPDFYEQVNRGIVLWEMIDGE
jgi:predicted nucleotidyltransferase